jgi:hypothetical protein
MNDRRRVGRLIVRRTGSEVDHEIVERSALSVDLWNDALRCELSRFVIQGAAPEHG